jgi:O-antigen/teichoic acid export membrane protein
MTARALGPSGKGALAALLFIGNIVFFHVCFVGLGDATVVFVGRGRFTLQRALSASMLPLLISSLVGIAGLYLVGLIADWSGILSAVAVVGVTLVALVYRELFTAVLNSQERLAITSAMRLVTAGVGAIATWLLVVVNDLEVFGGALAILIGVVSALLVSVRALRLREFSFRPSTDWAFLRTVGRYGITMQVAHLVIALSQRADQLIVYALAGEAAGGHYSVALTMAQLAAYLPVALAAAVFPRIAQLNEVESDWLAAKMFRVGVIGSTVMAALLALLFPAVTVLVFGTRFKPAITPALILLIGSLFWSWEWMLARAAAARGDAGLKFRCFGLHLAVMVGLDYLLVPVWGLVGGAFASVAGSAVGLAACMILYRRRFRTSAAALIPDLAAAKELIAFCRSFMTAKTGTGILEETSSEPGSR